MATHARSCNAGRYYRKRADVCCVLPIPSAMESQPFLSIGSESISLRQSFDYLRASGELPQFLQAILRQHVIEAELRSRADLEVDPSLIEQEVINFRLQNRLIEPKNFERWLATQRLNYVQFRNQIAKRLQLAQFKNALTAPKVEEYFTQNKALLDRVILSRIVVAEQDLAEELMRQILDDGRPFEVVAREHSIASDRLFNGMMGIFALRDLPEPIRDAVVGAQPGDRLGPVAFEGRYNLLRVEGWQPASLEGTLKEQLQDRVFEEWVQERLRDKEIKLNID